MPDQIRDGKGRGYLAGVTKDNRLLTSSVSVSKEHHTNLDHQDTYNMIYSVTPTADSVFLYIKNNSDKKIICEGFSINAPTDEIITIRLNGDGTISGGSAVVPANLTAGSGNAADGTFETGAAITGLSSQVDTAIYYIAGSSDSTFRNFDADIVIPKNQVLTIHATNGSIALNGFIVFWHDHGGI